MKEYLEIRIVGYNIFRILIVNSFRMVLPFPFARLLGSVGSRVRARALLSSKEKIDRVENTIGGIFPKERKEFSGRQVVPATGSKQRPARRNIMDRMLLRGTEMKTAKWCTRLSNWNVSALDGIPRSFFFLFPSPPRSVYQTVVPISRTYLYETVRFRETFAIRMNPAMKMGTRGKSLQNFSAKFGGRKNAPPSLSLSPRFHEQRGDICV